MGKFKQKKNKPHRNQPTGLPSEKECEEREESAPVMTPVSGSINHLVQKLQSPSEDERECTCTIISSLTEQPGAVQQLVKAQAVKVIGPQLVSQNLTLKAAALGALRNMSVEGDGQYCEQMVAQDIMTPLVEMFCQFSWNLDDDKVKMESQRNMMEQALHLLCNLCEASELAVSIFSEQKLLQFIVPCLNPDSHGINIALVAAQCLYAVSESNPALKEVMASEEVRGFVQAAVSLQQSSAQHCLLRTRAAGILLASMGLEAGQETPLVSVLSQALDIEISSMLQTVDELAEAAKTCGPPASPKPANGEDAAASMENEEETTSCPQGIEIKHRALENKIEEAHHVLQAQQLALQLLANMCCADDDEEEEEWEDTWEESEIGDEMDVEGVTEANVSVPTQLHALFIDQAIPAKVLSKTIAPPQPICSRLAEDEKTQKLIKSAHAVEVVALLCLGNLLRSLDAAQLGGAQQLVQLWQRLVAMATEQRVSADADLLEAVTNAMHNTVQKLAQVDETKLQALTLEDVQFLYSLRSSSSVEVRVNVIRIVAAIGQALGKQLQPHALMKAVGEFLLHCVRLEGNVWLLAEAVDAIMDVFAEDHLIPVLTELQMAQKLGAFAPKFITQAKKHGHEHREHLPLIVTVTTNLPNFIKYLNKHT